MSSNVTVDQVGYLPECSGLEEVDFSPEQALKFDPRSYTRYYVVRVFVTNSNRELLAFPKDALFPSTACPPHLTLQDLWGSVVPALVFGSLAAVGFIFFLVWVGAPCLSARACLAG